MGYICFRHRKNQKKIIFTNFLDDSSTTDDSLLGLMAGDLIKLTLEIQEETYNALVQEGREGVKVQEKLVKEAGEPPRYEAIINCRIINREHSVFRDWMMKSRAGFRVSTTTILVEATSDEAESLVIDLQKRFDELRSGRLGN